MPEYSGSGFLILATGSFFGEIGSDGQGEVFINSDGKSKGIVFDGAEKISSSGSHAVGFHALNAKVQLNPNTEYYIWCFALGDDGVTSYKSGFISVFGLNK